MGRIRSIKPEFWKSESIARLTMQTRLTFIALWNFVDDNGVGRDIEKLIAAEIYPLEDDSKATLAHVHRSLDELSTRGRIIRYTNDGKRYFHVTGWTEHQKIDRPTKKRYPQPDDDGSKVLTSNVTDIRRALDEPSTSPRNIPSPGAGSREQGAGSREQGAKDLSSAAALDVFDSFWAIYPKKEAKGAAAKAFKAASKKVGAESVIEGLKGQLSIMANTERKFIPLPASWLNAERWADEVAPTSPERTQGWWNNQ